MTGAMQAIRQLGLHTDPTKRVVVLLADRCIIFLFLTVCCVPVVTALCAPSLMPTPTHLYFHTIILSVRNYMSKHLNDGWMETNGFGTTEEGTRA